MKNTECCNQDCNQGRDCPMRKPKGTHAEPNALQLADWILRIFPTGYGEKTANELRRLHQHELAHIEWLEKTEWVQKTSQSHELGQHRADVLRARIEALEAQLAAAPQAVQAVVPSDADIDAAIQAFDWDGWIDQGKAKRAFTREALARWAAPAHPAEGVPAHDITDEQIEQAFVDARNEFMSHEVERTDKKLRLAFARAVLKASATHPTQQGMDAIAALQKVRDIAVSALLTGSLDRQDWIDDMDRIAAQAKQGGV